MSGNPSWGYHVEFLWSSIAIIILVHQGLCRKLELRRLASRLAEHDVRYLAQHIVQLLGCFSASGCSTVTGFRKKYV